MPRAHLIDCSTFSVRSTGTSPGDGERNRCAGSSVTSLIPRADGTGRVLALEILTNTPAVANVIREAKTYMLPGIIQTGKKQGMRLMDDALIDLYDRGLISGGRSLRARRPKTD